LIKIYIVPMFAYELHDSEVYKLKINKRCANDKTRLN